MSRSVLVAYQWLAGLMDTATGLLLVFAPAFTLRLMGLTPSEDVFVSFIGVFVLGVGLSYLLPPLFAPHAAARWEAQWLVTALIRGLVALFLLAEIAAGRMEPGWLTVAATDGVLALVQGVGLRRGWIRDALA